MVPVKLIMTPIARIITIDRSEKVRRASQLMRDYHIGALLVKKEDQLGIVTETDLTRKVMAEGLDPDQVTVGMVMTMPILSIESEATLIDANDLMSQKGIRHLGVKKEGKLIGLVSVRDLLAHLTEYPRN